MSEKLTGCIGISVVIFDRGLDFYFAFNWRGYGARMPTEKENSLTPASRLRVLKGGKI